MQIIKPIQNFVLISIVPQKMTDAQAYADIKELASLVEAHPGVVKEIVIQKRETHDKGPYIGTGKIEEIKRYIVELEIDVIVLNSIVKPGQILEMTRTFEETKRGIQVWDRADLILKIFDQHAHTAEAKLQIELAEMRHMGPRIYGMGYVMSQQGGGVGTRGIGETNTELMKRYWRAGMHEVRQKLKKLSGERERQIAHRERAGVKTVSIVGYTNAGKTSLFNLLSGKKNLVRNALFATLDASVAKLKLPDTHEEVVLSDTIGFIKNLPPELIEAFKSTLLESIHADVLLHVIDVTDSDIVRKIEAVEQILTDLNLWQKQIIYVFNKIDSWNGANKQELIDRYENFTPVFISVKKEENIEGLLKKISERLQNS